MDNAKHNQRKLSALPKTKFAFFFVFYSNMTQLNGACAYWE